MSLKNSAVKIGLFGAAPDTDNMGVSALFASTVGELTKLLPNARFTVFDNGLGKRQSRHQLTDTDFVEVDRIGARAGRRYYRPENLAVISFAAQFKSLGRMINSVIREIDSCDAILDVSGGDSFSDIYGAGRFNSTVRPKISTIRRGVPLILLPQTYGPYFDPKFRNIAVSAVKGAKMAWARDPNSYSKLKEMLGPDFDVERHKSGVDMAFALGIRSAEDLINDQLKAVLKRESVDGPVIGLNVNGLIYNDPDAAISQYGFKADYREIVHKFSDWVLNSTDATLVIVPHVMSAADSVESDPGASKMVADRFSDKFGNRLIVSPDTLDQNQTKWIISQMDWFCGTRMHSTIAALSTGVATSSVAYSDKTKGVFETCGQEAEVFDPRLSGTGEIVESLKSSFLRRKEIERSLASHLPEVKKSVDEQFSAIAECIMSVASNKM
jgi:polysaccharide pyruvyl transferase WcaK-like protein